MVCLENICIDALHKGAKDDDDDDGDDDDDDDDDDNNNNNITARMLGVFVKVTNKPLYIIHITFQFCRG
jgi:TATA-binding protein-associated factor Taf7